MKTKLIVFVTISTLALTGLAINSLMTFNAVKVGGDASNEVLASERLIADVLPPPAYIIEAYLTVQQLVNNTDPTLEPVLRQRLVDLEADYDERQTFYVEAVTDPDMTKALKAGLAGGGPGVLRPPARRLLPALDRGDTPRPRAWPTTRCGTPTRPTGPPSTGWWNWPRRTRPRPRPTPPSWCRAGPGCCSPPWSSPS